MCVNIVYTFMAPWSSGSRLSPLTAATRVRIPAESPTDFTFFE